MSEKKRIVINTGPILALISALGNLEILKDLYDEVIVPQEVCREIMEGGSTGFGVPEFSQANWLTKWQKTLNISPYLANSLDSGEAGVIQLALAERIDYVCIDEAVGRRVARLHGLKLTGSIGILIHAHNKGHKFSMRTAIEKMQQNGIWLSDAVVKFALDKTSKM